LLRSGSGYCWDVTSSTPSPPERLPLRLDLAADTADLGPARRRVRAAAAAVASGTVLDDVQLLVSELAANAIRHGVPPITVELRRTATGLRIEVHDDGGDDAKGWDAPEMTGRDRWRGLSIVDTLATRSGVEHGADGTVAWCELDLDPA
jgi:anti-sigma regulatory factor (Ser/Thr protein kinase)